jgi:choline dehydrogenase
MYKTINRYSHFCVIILLAPMLLQANCCNTPSTKSFDCITPTADYIIIGNGTAGATLARYLSDPIDGVFTNNVLVLEEGSNYSNDPEVLSTTGASISTVSIDVKYAESFATKQGDVMNLDNFAYSYGRMWGGSSAHNQMEVVRGTTNLYDFWATESGNAQWSYNNLLPVMLFMENYTPVGSVADPAQRGSGGPLNMTQLDYSSYPVNAFVNAWATMGNTLVVPDYNINSTPTGISSSQKYWNTDTPPVRSFSANAFLPLTVVDQDGKGVDGRRLNIVSEAKVSRILFKGTVAVGVEYILKNNPEKVLTVFARKKVILCAGGIESPAILQRSGVGPTALLESLDIPVVVDSPNVGQNLVNHYGARLICNTGSTGLAPAIGGQGFFDLSIDPTNTLGYATPFANDAMRRMQVTFSASPSLFRPYNAALLAQGIDPTTLIDQSNSFGCVIMNPNSRGTVEISDTNPLNVPQVNWNFYSDGGPNDAGSDASAVVAIAKIIRATMVDNFGADMLYPIPANYVDDETLFNALVQSPIIFIHGAGTCRMATNITDGVVDGNLNVHGVENLMVADISVEPRIQNGNTAYAAYLLGLVGARILGSQTVPPLS